MLPNGYWTAKVADVVAHLEDEDVSSIVIHTEFSWQTITIKPNNADTDDFFVIDIEPTRKPTQEERALMLTALYADGDLSLEGLRIELARI